MRRRIRYASCVKINAVRHDDAVAGVAERTQVFSCAAADRPDLIAGGNVLDQRADGGLLKPLGTDGVSDVDVEFCVVGEDQGNVDAVAHQTRQNGGGDGAVAVDEVKMFFLERLHGLRRDGVARAVADELCQVETWIADDLKGKIGVVGVRIIGGHDCGCAVVFLYIPCVIRHGVCNAVDDRGKGIVHQADVSFGHRDTSCAGGWVWAADSTMKIPHEPPRDK